MVIGVPVRLQLCRPKHQYILIAHIIILDHAQRREGLAQAHAISYDTAVVFIQFIDRSENRVPLKGIRLAPDDCIFEDDLLIRQAVQRKITQEAVKYIIKC